jgi:Ca2+-binding RTX toxin-like protein
VIHGGPGADVLYGGADLDTVSYIGSAGAVTVDLLHSFASGGDAQNDSIDGFENAAGGQGADTLFGSDVANRLAGSGGADTIYGGGGNDIVSGGAHGDFLYGGLGLDTVSYAGSLVGGVSVSLSSQTTGGGDASGDTIQGFENAEGSEHEDILYGDSGANRLSGRAGFDLLDGSLGNDTLSGGADGDQFIYNSGYGQDVITDFYTGADSLVVSLGPALDTYDEVMTKAHSSGQDTVLDFDGVNTLTLRGVDIADLHPENFQFV